MSVAVSLARSLARLALAAVNLFVFLEGARAWRFHVLCISVFPVVFIAIYLRVLYVCWGARCPSSFSYQESHQNKVLIEGSRA